MSMEDNFITVPIALSVDDRTRPWIYFRAIPRTVSELQISLHKEDISGTTVNVDQPIYNGRLAAANENDPLTIDETSFELVDCPTALSTEDFYKIQQGDADLTKKYYSEVETFVAKQLGCDRVICVHSQVRNQDKAGGSDGVAGYAGGAPHTDSSPISGDLFALDVINSKGDDDDIGEAKDYKRYCYLNLWRNIAETPIEDNHLAVLDERTTVKPDDYITKDLFGDGYSVVQYGLNARHANQHKWYYFPQMTKSEAILFKQMDSDPTMSGRICFHMSVSDPTAPDTATKPRESIEVRMLCLWKEADVDSMPTEKNHMKRDLIRDPLEVANSLAASSIDDASFLTLCVALLKKIPIFGRLVGYLFGGFKQKAATPYTGKPEDYLAQFTTVVNYFPSWPGFGKNWVSSTMKQSSDDASKGITTITKALVDDNMGYQKTKHFTKEEKAEIVKYLLGHKTYLKATQTHFAPLAKEASK